MPGDRLALHLIGYHYIACGFTMYQSFRWWRNMCGLFALRSLLFISHLGWSLVGYVLFRRAGWSSLIGTVFGMLVGPCILLLSMMPIYQWIKRSGSLHVHVSANPVTGDEGPFFDPIHESGFDRFSVSKNVQLRPHPTWAKPDYPSSITIAYLIEQPISYEGRQHQLSEPNPTVIGRDDQCSNLVLADPKVSRCHALITCENGCFVIHDLKSVYGTYVNNFRIMSQQLRVDDLIRIGDTQLLFVADES